jgi:hypothetical protein
VRAVVGEQRDVVVAVGDPSQATCRIEAPDRAVLLRQTVVAVDPGEGGKRAGWWIVGAAGPDERLLATVAVADGDDVGRGVGCGDGVGVGPTVAEVTKITPAELYDLVNASGNERIRTEMSVSS